jgi:hypothetical protein
MSPLARPRPQAIHRHEVIFALGRRADLPPGHECDRHALPSDAARPDAFRSGLSRAMGTVNLPPPSNRLPSSGAFGSSSCRRARRTSIMAPSNATIAPLPRNSRMLNAIWGDFKAAFPPPSATAVGIYLQSHPTSSSPRIWPQPNSYRIMHIEARRLTCHDPVTLP